MAAFVYTARNRAGEKVEGNIEAPDRRAALLHIESLGHIPISVTERGAVVSGKAGTSGPLFTWRGRNEKMGTRELLLYTTELSDLLSSGMTLGNALNALANRNTGNAGDKVIASLRDEIIRGSRFSDALTLHPRTFSRLYVSMIRAGEASGALGEVLRRLVFHYERIQEIKEKVTMALVYPVIVLLMGIATLVFSMIFVIPKFEEVFNQMGAVLPLPTRMLMGISSWSVRYGWFALAGLFFVGILISRALKTAAGTQWRDGLLLKMPLIKGVVASGIYANFSRTLETLLGNGVPVLQALGIVEKTVGNVVIAKEIRNARDRVTDGTTISRPLAAGKVFPVMMIDMLSIGEQTGDMCGALSHISRRYENELDRNLKIFTTALEPILIVGVAVIVGFVVISILMAVFSLTNGLGV